MIQRDAVPWAKVLSIRFVLFFWGGGGGGGGVENRMYIIYDHFVVLGLS